MTRRFYAGLVGLIVLAWLSHGGAQVTQTADADVTQVEARLTRYDQLVKVLDAKGIAAMFTTDGETQHEGQPAVRGRDALERLYASFAGYEILENSTTPSSTTVTGNTAKQTGSYHQKVKAPDGNLLEVSGSFQADWLKTEAGEWLIRRMFTKSP